MKDLFQRTKKICRDHDIKPARSRGQSFLIKEQVYNHIINAADITEKDRVLEVGPGLGFLTEKLAEKAGKVASVEVDETIYSLLQERLAKYPHLALIYKDILKVDPENIFFSKEQGAGLDYKIVANLPYNITSIFLRRFLAEVKRPTVMVLMLQKEVADRILSDPPESILSVMVRFYSSPRMIRTVSRKDFWPSPKVDSAVLRLDIKNNVYKVDEGLFFQLVRMGFSSRRKMLKNNLAQGLNIPPSQVSTMLMDIGVTPGVRAQELQLQDWMNILGKMGKYMI